jgi:hypothetical protein
MCWMPNSYLPIWVRDEGDADGTVGDFLFGRGLCLNLLTLCDFLLGTDLTTCRHLIAALVAEVMIRDTSSGISNPTYRYQRIHAKCRSRQMEYFSTQIFHDLPLTKLFASARKHPRLLKGAIAAVPVPVNSALPACVAEMIMPEKKQVSTFVLPKPKPAQQLMAQDSLDDFEPVFPQRNYLAGDAITRRITSIVSANLQSKRKSFTASSMLPMVATQEIHVCFQ